MIPGAALVALSQQGPISGDRIALVVVALISLSGLVYQARSTRRTAERAVDATAYERARAIDESVLRDLKAEIQRLREQVASLRRELRTEERAHSATKSANVQLRSRLHDVEQTVERMSRLLTAAGLEMPPSLKPRIEN